MKLVVISDNQYYRTAFSLCNECSALTTLTPDAAFSESVDVNLYSNAVVILNISKLTAVIHILEALMNINTLCIFIEPVYWPFRMRVFYIKGIFILPCKMNLNQLLISVKRHILSKSGAFSVNPGLVRDSEWSIMLYLLNGISNRQLAYFLSISEKTISTRVQSIASKMGVAGLNKATQIIVIYFFYFICNLKKTDDIKYYLSCQRARISDEVRAWQNEK